MGKVFKFFAGRLFLTSLFLFLQLCAFFLVIITLSSKSIYFYAVIYTVSLLVAVLVASSDQNPSFRIAWLILMVIFPVFGWLFYYMFSYKKPFKKTLEKLFKIRDDVSGIQGTSEDISQNLELCSCARRQINYLQSHANANVRNATQTQFFSIGEDFFEDYIKALNTAKEFIFIEYFIINEGIMWSTIFDILKRKAKDGVDIRVLYDDLGTINYLPKDFAYTLKKHGIKICVFNRYRASVDSFLNSRDHRKITVIDGKCCYTGGLNLSDEYINQRVLHGHWKDCAIKLCGDAVDDMTAQFLTLWHFSANTQVSAQDKKFFKSCKNCSDGVCVCFADEPYDEKTIGKGLYLNLIAGAQDHVNICTPYLILDSETAQAIRLCAQSGVKVKIITPHIPDKKWVHAVTRSNYDLLIKSGVEIYEYTKGFVHSKMIECDSTCAMVSTVNFDFRSFYLHFENGVFMYKSKAVKQVQNDFENLFEQCERIAYRQFSSKNPIKILKLKLLRLFSPLM